MKKLFLLSLILTSCHGKQIVPAGEGEPDNDYGMMVIDSQHKLREVPPMMIFHGKIDTTPPRNKLMQVQRTKGIGDFSQYEAKGTAETQDFTSGTTSKPATIIHNTDTITAYLGDTVRIKN